MSDQLSRVTDFVAETMDSIAGRFKPGAKVTVIVRLPGNDEADFMLTNDTPEEIGRLIARRAAAASAGRGLAHV